MRKFGDIQNRFGWWRCFIFPCLVAALGGIVGTADAQTVGGTVVAWGDNTYGQTNVPPGLTNAIAVASGYQFCLALKADGTVVGWGENTYGETNIPAGLSNVVAIAAGGYNAMALKADGTVVVWGNNADSQTNVPAGLTNVSSLAAGWYFCLALQSNGNVVQWGNGLSSPPAGLTNIVAIGAGPGDALGVRNNGTVVEWGADHISINVSNVVEISSGGYPVSTSAHGLVLTGSGAVSAWGSSASGLATIPAGASNAAEIASGAYYNLALQSNGAVLAWGGGYTVPASLSNVFAIAAGGLQSLAIEDLSSAPAILKPPVAQTNFAGLSASFGVSAVGPPPLDYQWIVNGSNIIGATNGVLTLTNIQPTNVGVYTVAVYNGYGSNFSTGASLTVLTNPPILLAQPTNLETLVGSNVSFAVTAVGPVPITYQWQFDQSNIDGATNAALVFTNVQPTNAGTYAAFVANSFGATNTSNIVLSVVDPANLGFALNDTNLVWTTTTNAPWQAEINVTHDGVAAAGISGPAASESLLGTTVVGPGTLTFWAQVYDGTLWLLVNGGVNQTMSGAWHQYVAYIGSSNQTLEWLPLPSFPQASFYVDQVTYVPGPTPVFLTSAPPASESVPAGTNVTFQVTASGSPPYFYQWQFNSQALLGATNASLALTDVQLTNTGTYSVVVSNAYGMTNCSTSLTVNPAGPSIATPPANQVGTIRGGAYFSVGVQGTEPLFYQWQFNSSNILGATNSSLLLFNLQSNNIGPYLVTVSNNLGSTNSAPVTLSSVPSQLVAWGNYPIVPTGVTNPIAVAAGSSINAALNSNGTLAISDDYVNSSPLLTNAVAIATSGNAFHILALESNGTVEAWGDPYEGDSSGQANVPTGLTNVVAVAVGNAHSLALMRDGTIVAWGLGSNDSGGGNYGQSVVPPGLSNVVAIGGGAYNSEALQGDGTLVVWGLNANGQTNVPPGLSNIVAMGADWDGDIVVLKGDGTLSAWGGNGSGETNLPTGLTNVVAIAVGSYDVLALRADGTVVAWGNSFLGPTSVPPALTNVCSIGAGYQTSIALENDGSAFVARQPLNQFVTEGASPVMTAGVVGIPPLNYQWQINGTNLPWATNAALTLTNIGMTDQGAYTLVVSNLYGAATSLPAWVTVLPDLQFMPSPNSQAYSPNGFYLQLIIRSSNGPVVISASPDLVNWQPIYTNAPMIGTLQFLDPAATNTPARFYKAVEQQ